MNTTENIETKEVKIDILKEIYKERSVDARKYDYGILLVIGGSDFYSGAPALASLAASKSGVDMVRIIAPKRAADIVASFSPNLAAYPLDGKWLSKEHVAILVSMTESAKEVARGNVAVVIGSGVGRSEETQDAIREYLSQISIPAIIDADAIFAVAKDPKIYQGKPFLFTPNRYEFYVLTGSEVTNKEGDVSLEERIRLVKEKALEYQTTILLKGKTDIISDGKEVFLNNINSKYMTVGGMGDTLSGIAGAMAARGVDMVKSACGAAYLNTVAGESAGKKLKESTVATDLIDAIPEILLKIT
ncbi:MAG: NAD(P)H-hydrate dehydratase [Candidatus Parcubacteria bacterium]|nr:NAD(P)H-hydrate dehydratase [Candidatus Parcubacteria bacterium]